MIHSEPSTIMYRAATVCRSLIQGWVHLHTRSLEASTSQWRKQTITKKTNKQANLTGVKPWIMKPHGTFRKPGISMRLEPWAGVKGDGSQGLAKGPSWISCCLQMADWSPRREARCPALHGQAVAALKQGFRFLGFLGSTSIPPLGLAARLSPEEDSAFSTQPGLFFANLMDRKRRVVLWQSLSSVLLRALNPS